MEYTEDELKYYKDMLEYIRTVPGCNYILMEE